LFYKSQKYENLLNEISKDLTLIQSNATEYITVTEKNNLLREAHAIKGELIKIKGKAKSMNDEKLLDLIEEREDFAEDVITLVNKRTIRKERKGTSFKLERDMTDQLKGMQHDGDYYGDEE
jgi:HPt (histidine-containing phosphotransfer) domain-containing protein